MAMFQILVIDDDPVVQAVLRKTLKDQGYDVVLSKNGEDGIAKAKQIHPALIICDWLMPGMDGLDVCREIKANPELASTFFILLTSRTAVGDRVRGLDTGADDFLPKPIELNELKARVRSGLRLYQSAQELQQLAQDLQTQKQVMEAELAEAADYVRSLLPSPLTGAIATDSRFIPCRQLGGDCFDYFWLDPDYLAIYLLDVSGHGLGSALPSVSVQNLLRSQSLPSVNFYQPSEVLKSLNEIFQMGRHSDRYFTIWYGVYNQRKQQLFYASAGHPPAIFLSGSSATPEVQCLKTRGVPIGMFPEMKYVSGCCQVEKGSTLYIFSDGVYEIKRSDGTVWGLDGFIDVLTTLHKTTTCTLDQILGSIQTVNSTGTFEDDCSLLQVKFS
jgi:phosphoserine phosphatase RsbU/P